MGYLSDNLPLGVENDPRAPWNQENEPEESKCVKCDDIFKIECGEVYFSTEGLVCYECYDSQDRDFDCVLKPA